MTPAAPPGAVPPAHVHSLRRRLTLAMLFVFALGLLASGAVFLSETRETARSVYSRTLRQQARDLLDGLAVTGEGATLRVPAAWADAYAWPGSAFAYTLFDPAGRPLALSPGLEAPLPRLDIPQGGSFSALDVVGPERQALLSAATPQGLVLTIGRIDPELEALAETEVIHREGERWEWIADSYPAQAVNLRSVADGNFVVVDRTDGRQTIIAEVDYSAAALTLYEGAIHMIQSEPFQVERLDWEGRKAYVTRTNVDYYTDAIDYTKLKVLDDEEQAGAQCE